MIKEKNDCVGCPQGVPCIGDSCPLRHNPHIYCDNCEVELTEEDTWRDAEDEDKDYCYKCAMELGIIKDDEEEE